MPAIKLRKIGGSTVVAIPPHVLEALALTAGRGLGLAKLQALNWAVWKESETPPPPQAAVGV